MKRRLFVMVALGFGCAGIALPAWAVSAVDVFVNETAGIRRRGYPVNARVPFPSGALLDPAQARLMLGDTEVAAQYSIDARWPDESIQWLVVTFNATLGPKEEQVYRLEYGTGVESTRPARGLVITDAPDAIQVGNIRFGRSASPLILSVKYRDEVIRRGANGFVVTDHAGMEHALASGEPAAVEVVRAGPLYVVIKYTGWIDIAAGYRVRFTITAGMPRSKSWVKLSARVEDPDWRLRDIALHAPLAFGPFPWAWDFGTGSWTYGALRGPRDSVILTQTVGVERNEWRIESGDRGREQPYEMTAPGRPELAEGWGHFQDAREAVGFAIDDFGKETGAYIIALDGTGNMTFRFAPGSPATHHELALYLHYVASPPQISAGTSPPAMLQPLKSGCQREHYIRCGVPPPSETVDRRK